MSSTHEAMSDEEEAVSDLLEKANDIWNDTVDAIETIVQQQAGVAK